MTKATTTANAAAADQPFSLRMPTAFWWTVRVPVPANDDYQLLALPLLFEPVPQPTLDAWQGLTPLDPDATLPTEDEICKRIVKGWRAVTDEEGQPLAFDAIALDAVLAIPAVRPAIVATYLAVMRGMGPRKNA